MEFSEYLPWKSRGYLSHVDSIDSIQMITFRLADSLPRNVVERLKIEIDKEPPSKRNKLKRHRIEFFLDAGFGCCALAHSMVANTIEETLLKFDSDRYELYHWCIMPNHVHVLIRPKVSLGKIVQSWKSYTGRWAMQRNEI